MICKCNNSSSGGTELDDNIIRHVQGNVLRLAIPLTKRTIEIVDGEASYTDIDFIPSSDYPVRFVFSKGAVNIPINATMQDGNIALIEERGEIPVGTYDITITCNDNEGNPYRFKQKAVLVVVDTTKEAGIETPIEYETATWYLDAALYLVLKGEDGVGISNIVTESSEEIGGFNTVTIYLTDGTRKVFTIMNGSGSVDDHFDINSHHPLSNDVITNKFNIVDDNISNLFGSVQYDNQRKLIAFLNKTGTKTLAYLDAKPFIKDGMVSNVYISNNTLVVIFNTDSGKEPIAVPLTSIFNPNNYYNRTQLDNRFGQYYTAGQIDEMLENFDGGGYNVTYSNGVLSFNGSNQPTYNNGILTI